MATNIGPKFNGEWSSTDIALVRSIIAMHNNNNNIDIVDVLHEQFPGKSRHQVIDLYVEIVVDIIMCEDNIGTAGPMDGGINLVNNNFGISEEPNMNNMEVFLCPPNVADKTRTRKKVEKQPRLRAHQPERRIGRFWTTEEHRLFLRGLSKYGRGNWKDISKHFAKTRTPVQVSSHAQKYFRRLDNGPKRQRFSINDVGLYDDEPWAEPNNSFGSMTLNFAGGSCNSNNYNGHGQQGSTSSTGQHVATMNDHAQVLPPLQYHIGQAGSSQAIYIDGGQQMGYPTIASPTMVGSGNFILEEDQYETFAPQEWMNNMDISFLHG